MRTCQPPDGGARCSQRRFGRVALRGSALLFASNAYADACCAVLRFGAAKPEHDDLRGNVQPACACDEPVCNPRPCATRRWNGMGVGGGGGGGPPPPPPHRPHGVLLGKGGGGGRGGQGIVIFFLTYIILVVWIFFQVSVAVLLDHFLAARRGLVDLMGLRKHGFAGRGRILGKVRGRKKRGSLQY